MDKKMLCHPAEISISYTSSVNKPQRISIKCSKDAERMLRPVFPSFEHREFLYVLYLNSANVALGYYQISSGGIAGTISDVRLIFQTALKANSTAIILCHNHPSGNLQPSEGDKIMTQKVKEAGKFLDIQVLDHLILSAESFFSFADENLL